MFLQLMMMLATAHTIGISAQSTEDTSLASTTESENIPNRVSLLDEYSSITKKHKKQFDKTLNEFNTQMKTLNEESTSLMESLFYKLLLGEQSKSDARLQRLQNQLKTGIEDLKEDIQTLGQNISESVNQLAIAQKAITKLEDRVVDSKDKDQFPEPQDSPVDSEDGDEKDQLPKDCLEVKERGNGTSGTYWIQPGSEPFMVLCNMSLQGGGWTVVQNRFDGSLNFRQNWTQYQRGFGNLSGEFWLGLDHLYELTGDGQSELLFKLINKELKVVVAQYDTFGIGNETEAYKVKFLDGYRGDAGDSFVHHEGTNFSTPEHGQDCSQRFEGGWWFRQSPLPCIHTNLNGDYYVGGASPGNGHGIHWYLSTRDSSSLVGAQMMVRRKEQISK